MKTELAPVAARDLQIVEYRGQRVVTTEQLASEPKLYSNSDGACRCTDGLQGIWKVDVREERRTGISAQPGTFTFCPITAPKHDSSAVENLKFKWLAALLLHVHNTWHELPSTRKRAYGVIGVQ